MFAHKLMRPLGVLFLLLALILAGGVSALAADSDPIDFTIQVSPESLTEPGEVKVSLRVANTGTQDMIDPVTLYDPAGKLVASFGDGGSYVLAAGAFRTWEGVWNVTQEELDAGEFAYTLQYHLTEGDELVELKRQAVGRVAFTGQRVKLTVSRSISPEVVRSGSTVTVTYELYNSGNVNLKDIRVKENISKNAQTVKELAAGAKQTLTFTSKIGNADLTSNASIIFKAEGATKTYTDKVDDTTITLAKPNLKIELSSPSVGVNIGEAAKLVITFTNAGNVSYSNVTVKDEKKGEIFTNLSIPAGATVVEEKEFILMEPTTFKVSATLPDNTGETKSLNAANELVIGVFDPEKTLLLTLNLTCDQEAIHQAPADVRFHLTVTNNSNIKAEKIDIYHGDTFIYHIAALEPGASMTLTRDATLSQAGKFRFTAKVKDTLQNNVSFDSNTLQIAYAKTTPVPTKEPVATVAPPVLVTAAPVEPILGQAKDILFTVAAVLAVLFAAAFVLFAASTVSRLQKKIRSKGAYDHLELAERRDYTEPAEEDDEDDEEEEEAEEESLQEDRDDAFDRPVMPHEKLVKPIVKSEAGEDVPAPEDMPASDWEGGYRVSRVEPKEEKAAEEEIKVPESLKAEAVKEEAPAEEKPAGEEAPRRRRSARRAQRTEDGE